MVVHARRTAVLPEEYRRLLFSAKNPASANTLLVDGVLAGTRRFENGRIALEPFRRLARDARRELDAEAERLAELYRSRHYLQMRTGWLASASRPEVSDAIAVSTCAPFRRPVVRQVYV